MCIYSQSAYNLNSAHAKIVLLCISMCLDGLHFQNISIHIFLLKVNAWSVNGLNGLLLCQCILSSPV